MGSFLTEISGDEVAHWADTAIAPTALPDLLRRLLLATAPLEHLNMPADGGTWQGGFDGVVIVREGGPFWPPDASVWELSVSGTVERKLNSDYSKRTLTT